MCAGFVFGWNRRRKDQLWAVERVRPAVGDGDERTQLVGGDLPQTETRNLVEQLDASSDGWKRCALAFMEAQTWEQTFQSLVPEAPAPASPAAEVTEKISELVEEAAAKSPVKSAPVLRPAAALETAPHGLRHRR